MRGWIEFMAIYGCRAGCYLARVSNAVIGYDPHAYTYYCRNCWLEQRRKEGERWAVTCSVLLGEGTREKEVASLAHRLEPSQPSPPSNSTTLLFVPYQCKQLFVHGTVAFAHYITLAHLFRLSQL